MEEEHFKQISLFRYGIISDFINRTHFEYGEKSRLLKDKSKAHWRMPYSDRKKISRSTILNWIKRYTEEGEKIDSLNPKRRSDIAKSRVIDSITADDIINLTKNSYIFSARQIFSEIGRKATVKNNNLVSYSTVVRFLHQNNLFSLLKTKKKSSNRIQTDSKECFSWMQKLEKGEIRLEQIQQELSSKLPAKDVEVLFNCIRISPLFYRKRALTILSYLKKIPIYLISAYYLIPKASILRHLNVFKKKGIHKLLKDERAALKKYENPKYINEFFSILHMPPSQFGINRTNWRQDDIIKVMKEKGFTICKGYIKKIIKNAGYQYKKAKITLTSNDPKYVEKVQFIKNILSNLTKNEKFFSVDEYGPFAIKMQGGKSLVPIGLSKIVPQYQKSKGSIIITGALELSTNQITYFFSKRKNTKEILKLLDFLLKKYHNEECIYFSWDAASWHGSKQLYKKVDEINSQNKCGPKVILAPLPISAQFLNLIESIFSGMARAIIHNSDYQSENECKEAIDKYFSERNEHFKNYPKRAGNKIWGKERVMPLFSESNNCKDPCYR